MMVTVQGSKFKVQSSRFKIQDSRFNVQGSGQGQLRVIGNGGTERQEDLGMWNAEGKKQVTDDE